MAKRCTPAGVSENSLNTLAQNGTAIIQGEGSDLSSDKAIKGRAKRKMISQAMVLSLIDVAMKRGDIDKVQSFWNTYHCQNSIVCNEGRIYGNYCKNRYCTLCCSIRKAEIINKYYPVIRQWQTPYFVTLTIKACKAGSLRIMVKALIRGFKRINEKYRKNNQRGKGIRLFGVKSVECNYNPISCTYNPHLHLIVANKEIAETLTAEWLALWTPKFTNRVAQHYRPIHDLEMALIETIKYGSKIFTEPDVRNKSKGSKDGTLYAAALYNIFNAMEGIRIFDRFGFDLPKAPLKERKGARVVTEFSKWVFSPQYFDWLNTENELTLSGYDPSADLRNLLENRIDKEQQ